MQPLGQEPVRVHLRTLVEVHTQRAQAAQIASSPIVTDDYSLFGFHVSNALAVTYDEEKKKIIRRWQVLSS